MSNTTVPATPQPYSYNDISLTPGGVPALQRMANGAAIAQIGTRALKPAVLQHSTVVVTSADLLAGFTTAIPIISAPSAYVELTTAVYNALNGNTTSIDASVASPTIILEQIYARMIAGATAYAAGGALSFVYHGTAVTTMNTLATAAITATASTTKQYVINPVATATGTDVSTGAGLGIDIQVATQNFTLGTGVLIVDLWYRIR